MTIGIFDNLALSGKMALIGATMLLGIGLPSYFYTVTMQENIVQTETELEGIRPSNELILLQKLMAESRGTTAVVLNGGETSRSQLMTKIEQVESAINRVKQVMTSATNDATLLRELDQIRTDWDTLVRRIEQRELSAKDSFARHSELIVRIDDLLSLVLNHFLLSYDPKAESHHLIIGAFENLPRVIDSIGQVRGLGAGELSSGEVGLEIRGQLRGLLYAAEGPTKDFIDNINAAATADERLADMVKDVNRAEIVMNSWFTLTEERVIRSTTVGVTPQEFFDGYTRLINDFMQIHEKANNALVMTLEERLQMYESLFVRTWTIIILLIVAATIIGILVNQSITTKAKQIIDIFKRIEAGDYTSEFQLKRHDEMGQIERALAKSNEALRVAAVTNREAIRVKEALENSSTNIMIANNRREIIYCNDSLLNMFENNEATIKDELPQFNASNIIGTSIDMFHQSPNAQQQQLEQLNTTYETTIQIGGLHFHASINPIFNEQDGRIGTVVEWTDRTAEINAEMEVASLVESILEGNFSKRIDAEGKEGFMAFLASGLNELVEVAQKNLDDIAHVMQALSTGDLTHKVEGQYQGTFEDLKNYANDTSDGLAKMLFEIRTASETILDASNSIARGSSDLSSRTEQQASALEETASSMEELTSTVKLNAENANQASELSSQATAVAEHGGNVVEEVITTMGNINESAKQIADIISVIDGIAFQTNILALNAAVEAARAGEQGRGFAVVASEVRTLAQRSANAAKDIKGLISESVKKVERGNDLVNQSGQTMRDIVVSVKQVNDIMSDIAAASLEQANGIAEVSKAVNQMDEMTQSNTSLVEQAANSADAMRNQAASLKMQVERFTLSSSPSQVDTSRPHSASMQPEPPTAESENAALNQQFEDLPTVGFDNSPEAETTTQDLPKLSANRLKTSQANDLTPNSAFNEDDWESF